MNRVAVVIVANPASGRGRSVSAANAVAARLKLQDMAAVVVSGDTANDAAALLVDAIYEHRPVAVVACGGDGTVSMCLQVIAGTEIALGIIPVGTGNDNASVLSVPADPREAGDLIADVIRRDAYVVVDAARATAADANTRWFLGVLSSGFDSSVNSRANAMTWPAGQARYIAAIVAELRVFRAVGYQVILDSGLPTQELINKPGMLVAVANGRQYGGGMRVAPDAIMDDGLLDITFLDELTTPTFLRVFPTVYAGTHVRRPEVHQYRAKTVTIDAPNQTAYADGELVGPLPVRIEIVPAALRVLTRPLG
jgi:diacylglycerol kinase (ATP)